MKVQGNSRKNVEKWQFENVVYQKNQNLKTLLEMQRM